VAIFLLAVHILERAAVRVEIHRAVQQVAGRVAIAGHGELVVTLAVLVLLEAGGQVEVEGKQDHALCATYVSRYI